jgi:hypothetical protein
MVMSAPRLIVDRGEGPAKGEKVRNSRNRGAKFSVPEFSLYDHMFVHWNSRNTGNGYKYWERYIPPLSQPYRGIQCSMCSSVPGLD